MKLSKRGEHGLRALQDLAKHYGKGPVPNKDLATRSNIPPRFLEQILLTLKHAQIVHSQKGPQGGEDARVSSRGVLLGSLANQPAGWYNRGVVS